MTVVEITDVRLFPLDPEVFVGGNLDAPTVAHHSPGYSVKFGGWVLARDTPIEKILVRDGNLPIANRSLDISRPDVTASFPDFADAMSGFEFDIDTLMVPEQFTLNLIILLEDERRFPFAEVVGRRASFHIPYTPHYSPISMLGLPRSGTTLLMRYLGAYPRVIHVPRYPYEMIGLNYWLHLFRVLTASADHQRSSHPNTFLKDEHFIGHHPHFTDVYDPVLAQWFREQYIPDIAALALRSLDGVYRAMAVAQDKMDAVWFAEKVSSVPSFGLQWTFYPRARSVFIVRDVRDQFCSHLAFSRKRDLFGFNYDQTSEREYFLKVYWRMMSNYHQWKQHPDSVHMLRYEDLILKPFETLTTMFGALGLDNDSSLIQKIHDVGEADPTELASHRTTESVAASIGRWKRELSREQIALFEEIFGDLLTEFGYEV